MVTIAVRIENSTESSRTEYTGRTVEAAARKAAGRLADVSYDTGTRDEGDLYGGADGRRIGRFTVVSR